MAAATPPEETTEPTAIIEARDDHEDDADSAFGDAASDLTSLSSNIFQHRYKHGRRYHAYKDGKYLQPNDEKQLNNQDIGHHVISLLLENKLHLAPIGENPQSILEIGTGSGIWAIDMADQYTSAEVVGIDLSPVQPLFIPPNCKFEIDDASEEWTFPPSSRDFVYFRFMLGCFRDWRAVYKQAFKCLKPGGWLEHHEPGPDPRSDDNSIPSNHPLSIWGKIWPEASEKTGNTFMLAYNTKEWMEEVGFINVVEKKYKLPIGMWPRDDRMKELGKWFQFYFETGMEGYTLAVLVEYLGWDKISVQAFLGTMKTALKDGNGVHAYCNFTCVYGQKPSAGED